MARFADEVTRLGESAWGMWALWREDLGVFEEPGHRRHAAAHGGVPVPVIVTIDLDGLYYGWVRAGEEEPEMIHPHPIPYRMCFPYGPQAEEDAGRGRTVRLRIDRR